MSIESPEPNVKFTNEQQRQLEAFQGRLISLQTEVSILSGRITNLRDENVSLEKQKISVSEQLIYFGDRKSALEKKVVELSAEVLKKNEELDKLSVDCQNTVISRNNLLQEIDSKRAELLKQEQEYQKKNDILEEKLIKLSKDRDSFDKKYKTLSEALNELGTI